MIPALGLALAMIFAARSGAAAETQSAEISPMIIELLRSSDRDTRGLALQEVREGLRGEAATGQLSALAPTLDAEGQAALIEALGDRGDVLGRGALLSAVTNQDARVRVAALKALGQLGTTADLQLLTERAALGTSAEKETAGRSLIQLRGTDVTRAMVRLLRETKPELKIELLRVLAARKASVETSPVLLELAKSDSHAVRLAAFRAAEVLATADQAGALVECMCGAATDSERRAAEGAVIALSRRAKHSVLDVLLRHWPEATSAARVSLLQCLAATPGSEALAKVVESVKGGPGQLQDEAVAVLASWEDPAAAAPLLELARETSNPSHHAAALRGVVRLASGDERRRGNAALLTETWKLTNTADEQRVVLGALGGAADPKALQVAIAALDQAAVRDEAAIAAVLVAERLARSHPEECAAAMRKVAERSDDPALKERIKALGLKP
ncbi:MAG: HEAT repeat domain-containing protein [Verrucomicrobiia bacterium]